MAAVLDLVRLFVGATLLSFAAWTDWRWRRAPNALWIVMALAGVALLAVEFILDPAGSLQRWPYLVAVPAFVAVIYGLWWLGLIAGGADAKALMAAALLAPFPVAMGALPLWPTPTPASFAILGNSLLLFMAIPFGFFVANLFRGDVRLPHAFLGVRRAGARVREGHAWPMETLDDEGRRRTRWFGSRMGPEELEAQLTKLEALGEERVWVTPKVPFMLPLAAGFAAAFMLGDLLTVALVRVLG